VPLINSSDEFVLSVPLSSRQVGEDVPTFGVEVEKSFEAPEMPSQFPPVPPMRRVGGSRVSIIPLTQAAQIVPAALAAGKVATNAMGAFAEMLRGAMASPGGSGPIAPKSPSALGTNWPGEVSALMRDFASAFSQLLSQHGLASGSPVRLRLDDQGDVKVAGDHPRGLAIENLLAKSPSLTELFRAIAAKATAHKKDEEFAAFQRDSRSGAESYPLLFSKEHAPKFEMTLQGESATAAFA
jgi:hypothetical protein